MEGPAAAAGSHGGEPKVMDQFLFMRHVLPVLLITWLVSNLGVNSLLLLGLFIGYLFWIEKQFWERERRRIQYEERKRINTRKAMTEGETLRWVNEGLKVMWPISMEKFASQHFFKPMAPWFLNEFKPKIVKEVTLQSLHLGSTPPDFSLIRALPSPQDGDDLVFEANMEFLSGKDMKAQMTVQMAGGIKTTFYISRLYIKGTVKFSVKFVKGWPVVGRVRFCFANQPIVDMTARPNFKNGLDMRFIPGAAHWLEQTLGTALEQSVVEPYMLVIDFEKLVSNMMFHDLRTQQGLQDFFTLKNKSGFSLVLVEILEAGDLKTANGAGLPDPIVEVTLGTHKERTKSKTKTLNPIWTNEVQRISIVNWALPNLLTLRVISKKNIGQRELGICSIPVKEYRNGERHVKRLKLENVPTGWIQVAITVDPHSNSDSTHGVESEGHASQPSTWDIESITPAQSAPVKQTIIHTRSSSTEDATGVPADESQREEVCGSNEVIKMPYGSDGAFSIQCPGEEESLYFPDPSATRKPKPYEKSAVESRDRDAKVKRSMMSILGWKKRTKAESSPRERETTLSEHSGYCSSLDRSAELKVYHGALKMNLLLPEMPPSRDAPFVDILPLDEPLKLETILSAANQESMLLSPDNINSDSATTTTREPNPNPPQKPHGEVVSGSTFFVDELNFGSEFQKQQQFPQPDSKNSWWKTFTRRHKRRRSRGTGNTKPDGGHTDSVAELHDERYDTSDTSAPQSFRKEPRDVIKALFVDHQEYGATTTNGSILSSSRSQSCRQDSGHIKRVVGYGLGLSSRSLRFDSSSSLLNTIHEMQHR